MGESYDDLVIAVELRWVDIRNQLDGATNAEIVDFVLAELERNDLKTRILERKAEKIIEFKNKFGKNDIEIIRNLKKLRLVPMLPIKRILRGGNG